MILSQASDQFVAMFYAALLCSSKGRMCFWLVFYVKQVTTVGAVTTTAPISHKADTQNTLLYDFSVDIAAFRYIWNPVAIFQYILYMSDFQRERNHHQEVVWLTSVCIFTVHWSHEWFFNQLLRHFKCLAWICLFRLSFVVALY